MTTIVISAGHGTYIRGACGILDEVNEAQRVVPRVAELMEKRGLKVYTYIDNVSTQQQENLQRIVDFHNSKTRDLDISIHFNAFEQTSGPRGTEVWYVTAKKLAAEMSGSIADAGFIDRGAKYSSGLYFLNYTSEPAILIEVCFVDSQADADIYNSHFDLICESIADVLAPNEDIETEEPLFRVTGKCSFFGGPNDQGVDPDEGLAFIQSIADAPQLFLPFAPEGCSGLARRLNPYTSYLACRWDYSVTPKESLLKNMALVRATKTGVALKAFPADWGPNDKTGRVADLSPWLMDNLGIETDDEVEIIYPYVED